MKSHPSPPRAALRIVTAALLTFTGAIGFASSSAQAVTSKLTVLHNFDGTGDFTIVNGLIKATDGNYYGITPDGGNGNAGTVFKITPAGTYSVVHDFTDNFATVQEGSDPKAIIQATDGNLYGVCRGGGVDNQGTIFKLSLTGTYTRLYQFSNDTNSKAPVFPSALVQGKDGNFYGLTRDGGNLGLNEGTFFRASSGGTVVTELFSFGNAAGIGYGPEAQLLVASDGNFYGVTAKGGGSGGTPTIGAIFKATTSGAVTKVHSFTGDSAPVGHEYALIQGTDGLLYGSSSTGGERNFGTIYKCTVAGVFTLLHEFDDPQVDGAEPRGSLVQAGDGNFYGGINFAFASDPASLNLGPGGYYRISSSGAFAVINKLAESSTGPVGPIGNLVEVSSGLFFGATGGGTDNDGTIVKLMLSPTIISSTTANATTGVSFSYGIRTYGVASVYSASGLPSSLTLNSSTGVISGKPTTAGTYKVTLLAGNTAGSGSATLTITVKAPAPVITSATTATATQGVTFTYSITATNSPTSYGASGLPAGLSVSTSTGKITGKATTPGSYSVTIAAFNSGGTGSAKLTLTVKGAPPVVTSATTGTATVGTAYSYQIVATNSPTKYGASGLPSGLTISTSTGKISGTPTKAGTFMVTIAAFNATGSGSAKLTLTVKAAAAKPVITSSLNPASRQGVPFSYQITATNSPTSYGESGLPTGLTFNQTTGKIGGTPTKAGTYSVTIAAFNSAGSGSAKLTLVVKPPA